MKLLFDNYYIYLSKIKVGDILVYLKAIKLYKNRDYKSAKILFHKLKYSNNPNILFKYGMCFYKERDWYNAYKYINKATSFKQNQYKKDWLIQLGYSNSMLSGEILKLEFNFGIKIDDENIKDALENSIYNNILELYKNKKYYLMILKSKIYLENNIKDHKVWYYLGCVYDEFSNYPDAIYCFKQAISFSPNNRNYRYRYAFALEKDNKQMDANFIFQYIVDNSIDDVKQFGIGELHANRGLWSDAIKQYLKISDKSAKLYYKLYKAYYYLFEWNKAIFALEEAMKLQDIIPVKWFYELGFCFEKEKNYLKAIEFYNKAIDRENIINNDLINRLIYCLSCSDLLNNKDYNYNLKVHSFSPTIISETKLKTPQEKLWYHYITNIEDLEIRKNVFLFESYAGKTISCNPYAILKELLCRNYEKNLYIVVRNKETPVPKDILFCPNIIFVEKNSNLYIRFLATAEYLINNTTFSPYFLRRDDQKYLNTWHGTPIKSLGKDQKNGFMSHANVTRNFLHATHLISPNTHTTNIMLNKYDIKDIFNGKFYEAGYPRVDLTLNANSDTINRLKERLNITYDKKVVLYAPTWRGEEALSATLDTQKLLSDLVKLDNKAYEFFFKGHHLLENELKQLSLPIKLVPLDIDINEFLSIVDCLISDYSSIIFDYLPLNRPIICYIYDFDEYISKRGALYFTKKELIGFICDNIDDVIIELNQIIQYNKAIDYSKYIKKFCLYDKGYTSKTVVDILLDNSNVKPINIKQKPVSLFFTGSFLPNGVTNSFKNLINSISRQKNQKFALVFDVNAVQIKPNNLDSFQDIKNLPIYLLGRVGSMMYTPEEKWIREKMEIQNQYPIDCIKDTLHTSFEREIRRIFGTAKFKNVINFDGYSIFWAILLSVFKCDNKIIYQHNDIYSEYKSRFPYLRIVIDIYKNYDKLVSVSKSCREANMRNLSQIFSISIDKFYDVENTINAKKVLALSKIKPKNINKNFNNCNGAKFINVARLSAEKDHLKLIKAFDKFIRQTNFNANLFIVGYGYLEEELKNLTNSLHVKNRVFFLDYQANPYYYMKNSDLFIFSSNYEGQGLVLMEAMLVNLPIITTNIEGVQNTINGTKILAVDNSEEGLIEGMTMFINRKIQITHFDHTSYNKKAVTKFKKLLKNNT